MLDCGAGLGCGPVVHVLHCVTGPGCGPVGESFLSSVRTLS